MKRTKPRKEYLGNDADRLAHSSNGRERVFARSWQEYGGIGILQSLMSPGNYKVYVSKRDIFVANTIIQWLGTNVGYGFLQTVEENLCDLCEGDGHKGFRTPCKMCEGTGFKFKGKGKIKGLKVKGEKRYH